MDNSNGLTQQGSKPSPILREWVINQVAGLAVVFGAEVKPERLEQYALQLSDIPQEQLRLAFWRAARELKFFPKIAEIRELTGSVQDGRPGPEEAWSRMPKGERMEQDTVIWCEEESEAYSAARPLLLNDDLVAARMCFLERYKVLLNEARVTAKPARWIVSCGFDHEDRLLKLSMAVQRGRIELRHAFEFVPYEKAEQFQNMLPGPKEAVLLKGEVTKNLGGWAGLLQHLRMENHLPEEIIAEKPPEPLTPEQKVDRKATLRQQAEILKGKQSA